MSGATCLPARVPLHRRWFGLSNSLEVLLLHMDLAEQVPGMKHGRLALGIYRRDVPLAEDLIEGMQRTTVPARQPGRVS